MIFYRRGRGAIEKYVNLRHTWFWLPGMFCVATICTAGFDNLIQNFLLFVLYKLCVFQTWAFRENIIVKSTFFACVHFKFFCMHINAVFCFFSKSSAIFPGNACSEINKFTAFPTAWHFFYKTADLHNSGLFIPCKCMRRVKSPAIHFFCIALRLASGLNGKSVVLFFRLALRKAGTALSVKILTQPRFYFYCAKRLSSALARTRSKRSGWLAYLTYAVGIAMHPLSAKVRERDLRLSPAHAC